MRFVISLILLLTGMGLYAIDLAASAFVRARSNTLYNRIIAGIPEKQDYRQADYLAAVSQVWSNRVGNVAASHVSERSACDHRTFEALLENATGARDPRGAGTAFPGLLIMLIGAFQLGSTSFTKGART